MKYCRREYDQSGRSTAVKTNRMDLVILRHQTIVLAVDLHTTWIESFKKQSKTLSFGKQVDDQYVSGQNHLIVM